MGTQGPDNLTSAASGWKRAAGFAVGIALVGFAVWVIASNSGTFSGALEAVGSAPKALIAAAVLLPLAHWHCTSVVFWLLTRRYGPVRLGEMHLLIGASSLLNLMPMRPGMFGRIAYHKRVNGIRVKDAVRVTVLCMALTGFASAVSIAAALAANSTAPSYAWLALVLPALAMALSGLVLAVRRGGVFEPRAAVVLGAAVRYIDTLVWIVRYAIAFALIGHPISAVEAAVFAGAAQLAMLIPFVGSGLGVREWGIGLMLPLIDRGAASALGLTADLLNRAAEVLVAVPLGLVCLGLLARRGGLGGRPQSDR